MPVTHLCRFRIQISQHLFQLNFETRSVKTALVSVRNCHALMINAIPWPWFLSDPGKSSGSNPRLKDKGLAPFKFLLTRSLSPSLFAPLILVVQALLETVRSRANSFYFCKNGKSSPLFSVFLVVFIRRFTNCQSKKHLHFCHIYYVPCTIGFLVFSDFVRLLTSTVLENTSL